MGASNAVVRPDAAQFAKDVQALLSLKAGCPVYEGEAPRDDSGSISVKPPFVVYSAALSSPISERGTFTAALMLDVWALNGWAACYEIAQRLDDALDEAVYTMPSGVLCVDRDGLVFNRNERDPNDERIRRMSGQYLIRFYPM